MAHVRAAICAMHLGSLHEQNTIDLLAHRLWTERLIKRRPTCAAVVFGRGIKQSLAAANATVNACLLVIRMLACESALGGFVAGHVKSQWLSAFGFEFGAPLIVSFLDFEGGHDGFMKNKKFQS
jgi:hypothetical protein